MEEAASARKRKRRTREGAATKTMSPREAFQRTREYQNKLQRERAARESYTYRSIADALEVPVKSRVCLFAVVYNIFARVHSGGTDFTVTLRIVDETRKTGISMTFFAKDAAELPDVKSSGDVISLHDVVVKEHEGDSFLAFDKKISSFALFERKLSIECSPSETSMNYHASERDKELLTQMRMWLPDGPLGLKDLELQLSGLKSDSTFDLVCKVLYVYEDSEKWIFYVWDGTDTPVAELQAILDAEAFGSTPLLQGPPLPRDVLCTMPCVGTILRIFSDKSLKNVEHVQNGIQNGIAWARFCNITCKQESGIWKGICLASSRVRLLSDKDGSVDDRLKMYDERKASKVLRQPMASFPSNVTDVEHKKAGYTTLMESLTHHEVTHKLKTLVRVVAVLCPCQASELSSLVTGDCCIRLTLEDPTARIHAYVCKDELVKFLGGPLTAKEIIKKLNKILGVLEPEDMEEVAPLSRNPPWIWCCLKSYYLDENNLWGSRRYQIFDTMIRD